MRASEDRAAQHALRLGVASALAYARAEDSSFAGYPLSGPLPHQPYYLLKGDPLRNPRLGSLPATGGGGDQKLYVHLEPDGQAITFCSLSASRQAAYCLYQTGYLYPGPQHTRRASLSAGGPTPTLGELMQAARSGKAVPGIRLAWPADQD